MDQLKLARENHQFLVTQVPNCLFGLDFQGALGSAYVLMQDIRTDQKNDIDRKVGPDDFHHCGFENGYVGITAPAAEVIVDEEIDLFEMATKLYTAFGQDSDTGEVNDRVTVSVKGHDFTFMITDYETDDPEEGWTNCTEDPLSVPSEQTMHRRVIIDLAA